MGNCFRKPSNPKPNYSEQAKLNEILEEVNTRASIDHGNQEILDINTRLHYPKLDDTKTNKLNKLLNEVVTKASIDYGNQEIRDIQTAVHTVLERIVTRVNERRIFKISRIVPCGSMVERTTVLKFNICNEMYTEFDFLANLEYSPNIICRDHNCGQCVKASELPVRVGAKSKLQEYDDKFWRHFNKFGRHGTASRCDHLFWREVNTCLGSDCQCFSVQYDDDESMLPSYSYKLGAESESDYRCDKCVVEMPTGILRVNHSVSVGRHANCSLAFMWTSKANTLPVYDRWLQAEARQVTSLPVHVDFLPALEVTKDKPDEATHGIALVPMLQEEARQVTSLPVHVDFLPALEVLKDKPDEATHGIALVPMLQEEARQVTSLPVHVDFLPALEVTKAKPDEATHGIALVPMLQEEARQVTSLPVHVDFLPALEILKDKPDEVVHDFFLVPKHCNLCGPRRIEMNNWRKSNCMAEIAYIVNEMSAKHRKCYKIIKYFLSSVVTSRNINGYYVKTVALNHSRECSDSSEGCAECVLKILTDLKHVYETETLTSFHESGVNILRRLKYHDQYIMDIYEIQRAIERLCSATDIVQLLKVV